MESDGYDVTLENVRLYIDLVGLKIRNECAISKGYNSKEAEECFHIRAKEFKDLVFRCATGD